MKKRIINKWHVLTGGFFSYMFDAMDITLLAVALPVMMKDLDMTMAEGGLLGTATLLGVGISSIVVGWYSDNYGRRKALIWSLVLFGALTAAISLSPNWFTVLILRFLAGLGLGGVWGIIAATVDNLVFLKNLLPADCSWSAFGIGANHLPTLYATIAMGGHIRIGMEDNVFYSKGELAKSNSQFVERAVRIIKEANKQPATPDEARQILQLDK